MPVFPLGAHVDDEGARFAVASTSAEAVEVCLVDGPDGDLSERRVELAERTFGVWHGHVPGVRPGQRYGYRVRGPYRPWQGLRANPAKILVDPYARRITGRVTDVGRARGWAGDPMTGTMDERDSLGHVPLSVVTGPDPRPARARPEVPWSETVITELHVRGYTKLHPAVPEARIHGCQLLGARVAEDAEEGARAHGAVTGIETGRRRCRTMRSPAKPARRNQPTATP